MENFSANKSLEPDMTRKKKEAMPTSQSPGEIGWTLVPATHVMGAEPVSFELASCYPGIFQNCMMFDLMLIS